MTDTVIMVKYKTNWNIYRSYKIFIVKTYVYNKRSVHSTYSHFKRVINITKDRTEYLALINVM